MEVSGHFHVPAALPPGKEPPVPIEQKVRWAHECLDVLETRNLSCPSQESNPGSSAP